MRSTAFWPVAFLSSAVWLLAVVLFYLPLTFPIEPLNLVPVVGLFYLPSLLVGIWAGRPGTLSHWSRGRLLTACLLAPLGFLPWALATLPLLPLTVGALLLPLGLLVWGWRHQRGTSPAPLARA